MSKNCKICNKILVKQQKMYCSAQCRYSDKDALKREPVDLSKNIKCKIDGKIFTDTKNYSGALTRYSVDILKKPFDWADWEIIDAATYDTWNCPYCPQTIRCESGLDSGGWIRKHLEQIHNITFEKYCDKFPEMVKLWPHKIKVQEKQKWMSESESHHVQCLECGQYFTRLQNTHLSKHGLSMITYRQKYPDAKIQSEYLTKISKGIFE